MAVQAFSAGSSGVKMIGRLSPTAMGMVALGCLLVAMSVADAPGRSARRQVAFFVD
jgi:hypothetical protein